MEEEGRNRGRLRERDTSTIGSEVEGRKEDRSFKWCLRRLRGVPH